MMEKLKGFALYRKPGEETCYFIGQTKNEPEELISYKDLAGKSGFVFAPFAFSKECPILIIKPDIKKNLELDNLASLDIAEISTLEHNSLEDQCDKEVLRENYKKDFQKFHLALEQGSFDKLVLARTDSVKCQHKSILNLFSRACNLYPNLFVAIVSTKQSGTWLMTTPEVLLRKSNVEDITNHQYTTMALAGTKADIDEPWSGKNIREQGYVVDYIESNLRAFSKKILKIGPRTVQAGSIYHIRTDFNFSLNNVSDLGNLIEALHPTPAVCGLPKKDAKEFILANEHIDRKYYSGFLGPLGLVNSSSSESSVSVVDTSLYVSLRCAEIISSSPQTNTYKLYAGGGLVLESEENKEWVETKEKMSTILNVIS